MNILVIKIIVILVFFCCSIFAANCSDGNISKESKENKEDMEQRAENDFNEYYNHRSQFKRSDILENCEEEIPKDFVEVDPRPKRGIWEFYVEEKFAFDEVYKEEIIDIYKNEYFTDTTKSIRCHYRDEEEDISIRTSVRYDKNGELEVFSIGVRSNRITLYSTADWFEKGKLVKIKRNGIVWEIIQGKTPCVIEVAKPRCRLGYEYDINDMLTNIPGILPGETPCDIEKIEPNAKSISLYLNPKQPITPKQTVILKQAFIMDPYDAIRYSRYPLCKSYSEKLMDEERKYFYITKKFYRFLRK